MSYLSRVAIVLLISALAACSAVQVGQDFDLRAFEARIERGVSTQSQVRAWLGAPAGVGVNVDTGGERFEEWTYYSASGRLPDMAGAKVKMLQIKFDKQGIVRGYSWSDSARQ